MSVSAVDCVGPAFQHTGTQLFSPFRFGQWSRLALVAVLAGELHVGSCNSGKLGQLASQRHSSGEQFLAPAFPHLDPARIAQFAGLIAAIVLLAIVLFFVFLYVNSVFRFILFESVLRKECSIGDGWQRWHRPGRRYFLWQLVLVISTAAFFALLIGIPIAMMGWTSGMKDASGHLASMAGSIVLLVLFGLFCLLMLVAVQTLARDFLVPIMALEDLDFADAWSRLLSLIRVEPWRYVGYLLLKLVMVIVAWIIFFHPRVYSRPDHHRTHRPDRRRRHRRRTDLECHHHQPGDHLRNHRVVCAAVHHRPGSHARDCLLSRVRHVFLRGALSEFARAGISGTCSSARARDLAGARNTARAATFAAITRTDRIADQSLSLV